MPPTVSVDLTADELDLLRRALLELTVDLDKRVKEGLRGSHREARRDRHEADLETARLLSIKLMGAPGPSLSGNGTYTAHFVRVRRASTRRRLEGRNLGLPSSTTNAPAWRAPY